MKSVPLKYLLLTYSNGNKFAQEELMRRCLIFVKSKVYANNIKCRDQKEELVMQVIVKILIKINTFKPNKNLPESGFWAWIATICYNSYMDFCRHQKKINLFISVDETYEDGTLKNQIAGEETWLRYISKKDKFIKLVRTAKQLPEKYFTIIKLKYWFDMNYEEIAEYLHETENNIRVMHHRALKKLHSSLISKSKIEDNWAA
jgi:RNA polymerase sigma-70 factor (ECF subfamily)